MEDKTEEEVTWIANPYRLLNYLVVCLYAFFVDLPFDMLMFYWRPKLDFAKTMKRGLFALYATIFVICLIGFVNNLLETFSYTDSKQRDKKKFVHDFGFIQLVLFSLSAFCLLLLKLCQSYVLFKLN